jgi:hypothetical protein
MGVGSAEPGFGNFTGTVTKTASGAYPGVNTYAGAADIAAKQYIAQNRAQAGPWSTSTVPSSDMSTSFASAAPMTNDYIATPLATPGKTPAVAEWNKNATVGTTMGMTIPAPLSTVFSPADMRAQQAFIAANAGCAKAACKSAILNSVAVVPYDNMSLSTFGPITSTIGAVTPGRIQDEWISGAPMNPSTYTIPVNMY